MIKRIWCNLKWLFNHPPTYWKGDPSKIRSCDYCNDSSGKIVITTDTFSVCIDCVKKALDFALKTEAKK
jgi:hypothetical protein